MPAKEVIVKCYDKSATLLTTSSAVSIDSNTVLMYGLPLIEIMNTKHRQWFESAVARVNSEIQPNPVIDEEIEFMVHEEDTLLPEGFTRPGCTMIAAGMWTCPLVKATIDLGTKNNEEESFSLDVCDSDLSKQLCSLFLLLENPQEKKNLHGHHIANIISKLGKPSRGQNIVVQFTPFLDHALINSVTRGIIGKVFGKLGCMFLTDAVTTPCSSGAPIFLDHNESSKICGSEPLLGITCKAFKLKEVTVGISLLPVLWRLQPHRTECRKYTNTISRLSVPKVVDETIVSVSCCNSRSTGIVVDAASGIIITSSHGITDETASIHVLSQGNVYPARLVYKTRVEFPCDLAVIEVPSADCFSTQMDFAEIPAQIGERLYSVGFPYFPLMESSDVRPFLSVGYATKCSPSFMLTTCFAFPGHSGGAIMRNRQLLGMTSAYFNQKIESIAEGKDYFRLSLAIPVTIFADYIKEYIKTKNIQHLKDFETSTKKYPCYWLQMNPKM